MRFSYAFLDDSRTLLSLSSLSLSLSLSLGCWMDTQHMHARTMTNGRGTKVIVNVKGKELPHRVPAKTNKKDDRKRPLKKKKKR